MLTITKTTMTKRRFWVLFAFGALLCLAGYAFVLNAHYPGRLNADTVWQIQQALGEKGLDDWQAPFPKLLLAAILKLGSTPVGFAAFSDALIWGGLLLIAARLSLRIGAAAYLLVLIPLLPGVFNFLGHILYDTLLVGWLLAASATAYAAGGRASPPKWGRVFQGLANLFLLCAFLTKPNVIFALVPLLLYANRSFGLRRNLVYSMCFLIAMPFISKTQNSLLGAEKTNVANAILVHNLLGMSFFAHKNLFPGQWSDEQSARIANSCYSPVQWDTAWTGQCWFIFHVLKQQGLWGRSGLARAWFNAVSNRPDDYFNVLNASFQLSMHQPNSPNMLYRADNPWHWQVADDPARETTKLAVAYLVSDVNIAASKPWLFALVSCLAILYLFRTGKAKTPEGQLALTVLLSGLIFLLTYFLFNVSAEYRYFYWSGFAAYAGGLVAILAPRPNVEGLGLALGVRGFAVLVVSLVAALVFAPFSLPVQHHTVSFTPLDEKPVLLASVRGAATPPWMYGPFEGLVFSTSWQWVGEGFRSSLVFSPFVAEMDTLAQGIHVDLISGPGMGRVQVEATGFREIVDTAAEKKVKKRIVLPTSSLPPLPSWMEVSMNFLMALGYFLVFMTIAIWLAYFPRSGQSKTAY